MAPITDRILGRADWLNANRIALWSLPLIALWVYVGFLGATRSSGEIPPDFAALWAAGEMVWDGEVAMVYDWDAHAEATMAQFPGLDVRLPWIHLPPSLFLAAVFGLMSYPVAFGFWLVVSVSTFGRAINRIVPSWPVVVGTLASGLGLWGGYLGQTGMFLAAAAAGVFIFAEKRPYVSGLCLAVFVLKPHLAIAIVIGLLAQRRWKTLGTAVGATLSISSASVLAFGFARWTDFWDSTKRMAEIVDSREAGAFEIQSIYPIAREFGLSGPVAGALYFLAFVATGTFLWRAYRSTDGTIPPLLAATTLVATTAMSPRIFTYDMYLLLIAVAFLASIAQRHGFLPYEKFLLLVILFIPVLTVVDLPGGLMAILLLGALLYRRWRLEDYSLPADLSIPRARREPIVSTDTQGSPMPTAAA